MKCGWKVYYLEQDRLDDFSRGKLELEDIFTEIPCNNKATSIFKWDTERSRKVYGNSTPVCDEHLHDFRMSNELNLRLERNGP